MALAHEKTQPRVRGWVKLREETKRGVALADVLGAPDATETEALTWFFDEVKKPKTTPVEPTPGGGQGGKP